MEGGKGERERERELEANITREHLVIFWASVVAVCVLDAATSSPPSPPSPPPSFAPSHAANEFLRNSRTRIPRVRLPLPLPPRPAPRGKRGVWNSLGALNKVAFASVRAARSGGAARGVASGKTIAKSSPLLF